MNSKQSINQSSKQENSSPASVTIDRKMKNTYQTHYYEYHLEKTHSFTFSIIDPCPLLDYLPKTHLSPPPTPHLKVFCCAELLDDSYQFDRDGVYCSIDVDKPREPPAPTGDEEADAAALAAFEAENEYWGPRAAYIQYIETLPLTAGPAVFGLHENANIMYVR